MKKNNLVKPQIKSRDYWDYHEVIEYIEAKYGISTRGYIPKCGFTEEQLNEIHSGTPYLDFWHWIVDRHEIHNGSIFYLNLLGDYEEGRDENDGDWDGDDEYRPRWVREIQKMIFDEFGEGEMEMLTAW